MKKLRGSAILMIIAILGVTGFQVYWLRNNYDREKTNLELISQTSFRETIVKLQSSKLKLETFNLRVDSVMPGSVTRTRPRRSTVSRNGQKPETISLFNLIQDRARDSAMKGNEKKSVVLRFNYSDSITGMIRDTMQKAIGSRTRISLSRTLDSMGITPDMIREVHVQKGIPDSPVVIGYGNRPSIRITADTSMPFSKEKFSPVPDRGSTLRENSVIRLMYEVDSLSIKDSVTIREIDSAYALRLKEDKLSVDFKVNRLDSGVVVPDNAVTIGFSSPASYQLSLQNTFSYYFHQLKLPLLFSLLLVGITIASFVLLYRNMMKQKRLSELKNEFISNITHELKTPIATVGVAIEALKNFNALDDPERTREYLSISQNELQRLNLLVDKVLRLSMFEKKEIELKYELVNLNDIVEEVTNSMRLQVEKYRALVTVNTEGDCSLMADRLHILSVVFNLLDNALKYGNSSPVIAIHLEEQEKSVLLRVSDNGMGIPAEYQDKIFEKFFRVPQGDTHNAKGYGLGLSYTAHVIRKHKGTIAVSSVRNQGTTFTIILPKQPA